MKKFFSFLVLLLSFFSLLVCCTPDSLSLTDNNKISIVSLWATIEGEPGTKTEFGQSTTSGNYSQILWKAGDQINVFYANASSTSSSKFETEDGGAIANFSLVSGSTPGGGSFLGLSPYNDNATANISSKTISTSIPIEQKANANSYDPEAFISVGYSTKSNQMAFYNVCGGLCFTLTGSNVSKYSQIELKGNANEKIVGPVNISCSTATAPISSSVSGSSTTATLILPEGKSFEKNKKYYLLFLPTVFSKGFTISFKDASGNVLVKSECKSYVEFKRSVFASVNGADNPDTVIKIRDGELLSKDGTANCYIVSKAGSYKFPLSRATETDYLSGVTNVKVLWETDNTSGEQSTGSIITNVGTNKKYIYFDTPTTLKEGNAVIAAYSNKEIVWSWHIWVCKDYNPVTSSQKYTGKKAAMMDRNLGALSATASNSLSNGLFYQWGRKDPFPGAVESYVESSNGGHLMITTKGGKLTTVSSETVEATVDYAIAHPDTYITTSKSNGDWLATPNHELWGQSKTIYDPCPAGWKVPAANVLDSNKQHVLEQEAWSNLNYRRVDGNINGVWLDSDRAWYPNNGYISLAGKLLMVGQYSCYWSSSRNSLAVYAMEMSKTGTSLTFDPRCYGKVRGEGHSVRCVKDN